MFIEYFNPIAKLALVFSIILEFYIRHFESPNNHILNSIHRNYLIPSFINFRQSLKKSEVTLLDKIFFPVFLNILAVVL